MEYRREILQKVVSWRRYTNAEAEERSHMSLRTRSFSIPDDCPVEVRGAE